MYSLFCLFFFQFVWPRNLLYINLLGDQTEQRNNLSSCVLREKTGKHGRGEHMKGRVGGGKKLTHGFNSPVLYSSSNLRVLNWDIKRLLSCTLFSILSAFSDVQEQHRVQKQQHRLVIGQCLLKRERAIPSICLSWSHGAVIFFTSSSSRVGRLLEAEIMAAVFIMAWTMSVWALNQR